MRVCFLFFLGSLFVQRTREPAFEGSFILADVDPDIEKHPCAGGQDTLLGSVWKVIHLTKEHNMYKEL